jgi:protein tyrosine phosphatase (PTP) superfamily phosphohydrolase (DUF442 family)
MKHLLILLCFLSPYTYALDGVSIPNSFQVDNDGNVFRGKEPGSKVDDLAHIGITDVIIFKNEVKDEVQKEQAALKRLGIKSHHIPFHWRQFPSMIEACEQTVEALNIINKVKHVNGKVFFHCTAGEDRTGMLAGLYKMLEGNLTKTEVFKSEMCAHGYSDGNSRKPHVVSASVQKELTPLFSALADKIRSREWKLGKIDKRSCQKLLIKHTTLRCQ